MVKDAIDVTERIESFTMHRETGHIFHPEWNAMQLRNGRIKITAKTEGKGYDVIHGVSVWIKGREIHQPCWVQTSNEDLVVYFSRFVLYAFGPATMAMELVGREAGSLGNSVRFR